MNYKHVNNFSTRKGSSRRPTKTPPKPSAIKPVEDSWIEVVDKPTGQIYYWNQRTDETTALGAPRPNGPTALGQYQEQQPGITSGIGSAMAQGFTFGIGSGIAHGVVGSFFGGHGSSNGGSGGDGGDSYDI